MIIELSRSYTSCFGRPEILRVDTAIFIHTYRSDCMEYELCSDNCCRYGADIDIANIERFEPWTDALEAYTGTKRTEWFGTDFTEDDDFPGGKYTRTVVKNGSCVFANRNGRGCLVHSFCLDRSLDFHLLKPLVSALFPVTFDRGTLLAPSEVMDMSLFCLDGGSTLYRGARNDLLFFFGNDLVVELDGIERDCRN